MSDTLTAALDRLTRIEGVQGAMVVDTEAGVPVASRLTPDVQETALAAMSGALFTRTTGASESAGFGPLRELQLEGADGHVVVAGAGPLLVVALTEPDARLGLVRIEVREAAGELME